MGAMGLGGGPGEWADYEWVRLSDLRDDPQHEAQDDAVTSWLHESSVWAGDRRKRILLVDLDNLRADPTRWKVRMAAMVALARQADAAYFAGQRGAVRRAKPQLAEFAASVTAVPDGSDLADHALLDALTEWAAARRAAGRRGAGPHVTVVSNDGIFAALAAQGPLTVVSPGRDALSAKLHGAADRVVDLEELEAAAPRARKAQV